MLTVFTPAPSSTTVPARSRPRIAGSSSGMRALACPLRSFQSMGLMLVAACLTRTSPAPGLRVRHRLQLELIDATIVLQNDRAHEVPPPVDVLM